MSTRANTSSGETAAEYVLLWASCALLTLENAALEHAVWEANKRGLPLLAAFALTADYPGANERSFAFLITVCDERDQLIFRGNRDFCHFLATRIRIA